MKIKDIMKQAVAVNFDISLKEASRIMAQKNIGSLIVLKDEEVAGIVTEKDITSNASSLSKKVSDVMIKKLITINEDEDVDSAAAIMAKNKIKRIPVLTKDNKLAGIVTVTEILANSEELNEDFFLE